MTTSAKLGHVDIDATLVNYRRLLDSRSQTEPAGHNRADVVRDVAQRLLGTTKFEELEDRIFTRGQGDAYRHVAYRLSRIADWHEQQGTAWPANEIRALVAEFGGDPAIDGPEGE